jgi:crotonobetainyl-CoA:carnitine CoA-transferase CaiB-like acyl-CoA transferase
VDMDHPVAGSVPTVASPMRFSETPVEYRHAPPTLGQHTDEVLKGLLKMGDAELERLRVAKII